MTTLELALRRRSLSEVLTDCGGEICDVRAGLIEHSHRLVICPASGGAPMFTAVVPERDQAVAGVEAEGHLLVELRRRRLGSVGEVVPRHVEVAEHHGRPVPIASAVPGEPVAALGNSRGQARRTANAVSEWMQAWWRVTAVESRPSEIGLAATDALIARYAGDGELAPVLSAVSAARARLASVAVPYAAVHGCLCPEHVLVAGQQVTGVEDWGLGQLVGDPLRDLGRFAVTYAGHQLTEVVHGRRGTGTVVREFVRRGLAALGLDVRLWRDVLVLAEAEQATGNNPKHQHGGLTALASYSTSRGD